MIRAFLTGDPVVAVCLVFGALAVLAAFAYGFLVYWADRIQARQAEERQRFERIAQANKGSVLR